MGVGGIAALVGVIGLATGIGETTTTTTLTSSASSDQPRLEAPEVFLTALAKAEREGDADFRFERLHPEVIARYGKAACREYLDADPADPTARFEEPKLDHIGPWDYTSDGKTKTIADTAFVTAKRYAGNEPTHQVVVHIAPIGDEYRWFFDCTPA